MAIGMAAGYAGFLCASLVEHTLYPPSSFSASGAGGISRQGAPESPRPADRAEMPAASLVRR